MLLRSADSCLIVVDAQERLVPAIDGSAAAISRIVALIQGASLLGVPVLATEHCPDRLGGTVEGLRRLLPTDGIHPKTSFAFPAEVGWADRLRAGLRRTVVLAGFEAHVCVCQSALALIEAGFRVAVVNDAVGSIRSSDRETALARLRAAGASVVGAEMALFEWLERGDHPAFREVLELIKEMRRHD